MSDEKTDLFAPGAVVLVTLNNPREKYWGAVIAISTAGISLRGVDLNSFEDFTRLVKAGEDVALNAVFFPMHRVERVEMDSRSGDIQSMQDRFHSKTGRSFAQMIEG
ncbi:MAG: hypothetical protein JWO13_2646 [Acidobacteriales bacterium]|nr:hypothetical protein [Terriglobales bacterium]